MKNMYIEFMGDIIIFPIPPEEIKISSSSNNETFEVVKLGEVSILKDRKLKEFSIASFFPKSYDLYPFLNTTKDEFIEAELMVKLLEKIRLLKKPFRFILDDSNINMLCSIEDFTHGYMYGDDDIHFEIKFKEYKDISVQEIEIETNTGESFSPADASREEPSTKKVVVGCDVKVNGIPHRDSFGTGPGTLLTDFEGKLNFVKEDDRSHPYHVTDKDGGYKGWVTTESVEVL